MSSSGSIKSDKSMNHTINLNDAAVNTDEKVQQERPDSPVPSCMSLKSDTSMYKIINFKHGAVNTDEKVQDSPMTSCMAMESASSMDHTTYSMKGANLTDQKIQQERPDSPVPSCMSLKSDNSMYKIINFKHGAVNTDEKVQDSPMTSCMAMESASSMDHPTYSMKGANLTDQKDKIDLSPILQRLQDSVLKFWLDEMKTFKRDLSQEYPHQFDSNLENSNVLNDVTMMLQKCARKGALKITLHSLRNSNQESLARTVEESEVLRTCQEKLKSSLRIKSEYVFEGLPKQGCPTLLNDIYTDMYITEGGRGEVEDEHEVGQIVSKRAATQETVIKSNDIFNLLPGQEGAVRTVLTKGVAGIGKTISVQKVILDWAEGKANQDICFILALPFRELNLIKHKDYSLIQIIHNFFPEMQEFKCIDSDQNKVLLIFDGLDECRLPLDFQNNETCCDAHESVSVDVVLTNLIKGNLLPSALLWITTRPAAANRIPPECFDRVTEVRGFNDQQKEEYLIKKILDKSLASRITTHMKSSRSLYILCHIPVICWIVATVLQGLLVEACSEEIPCTLTQMYSNLVALQLRMKSKRSQSTNQSKSEDDIIQKLGKLAFQQLETGNLVFYEEDLKEIGIDVSEASEYCSWFTEIFKEKSVLHQKRIFYFVHLSVQEFLAALFVFLTFQRSGKNLLDKSLLARLSLKGRSSMNLYKSAVDRALQSQNGHLDLFLRFLLGLSLESNQAILKGFMTQTQAGTSSEDIQRTVQYIKEKIREYPSPQRCINLFHCLNELNDKTLVQEIQSYLSLGSLQLRNLTPTQWSALAFVLLTSQEDLDVFDLKKYVQSDGGLLRLLPVVRLSKIARLDGCNLTDKCCEALASVMGSSSSLVELDLSDNNLQDSGVKLLSKGLGNPHCKLEILRLSLCGITDEGCVSLAMALSSNPTHLKELDLSFNYPEESGVEQLSAVLEDPHCKLEALSIDCLGSSREKWRLLKYACQLTLDSNTANKMLRISEDGRNVENTREVQLYADHPDRFSLAVQVLCGEGLSDRCYWEVEFGSKKTKIAATYRGIPKMEEGYKSWLGWNEMSWSWYCTDGGFSARHNRKRTPVCAPPTDSNRVGVYMDWPAGTLTLYSVTSDMVTLLHTFYTSFTEPIYPAFSVVDTLCLCPIETPYERHEYAQ